MENGLAPIRIPSPGGRSFSLPPCNAERRVLGNPSLQIRYWPNISVGCRRFTNHKLLISLEFSGSGRAIHPITPLDLGLFTVRRAAG
jgi:hypothetical protein